MNNSDAQSRGRSSRRRAFASFSAVVLVGTSAIALTALARVTTGSVSRANEAVVDAQLRQLLLAGQAYLKTQAPDGDISARQVALPLPGPLQEAGATLILNTNATTSVTLTAEHRDRVASTTLVYNAEQQTWQSESVTLP